MVAGDGKIRNPILREIPVRRCGGGKLQAGEIRGKSADIARGTGNEVPCGKLFHNGVFIDGK